LASYKSIKTFLWNGHDWFAASNVTRGRCTWNEKVTTTTLITLMVGNQKDRIVSEAGIYENEFQ
jgi:prophage antirepressor-like protein